MFVVNGDRLPRNCQTYSCCLNTLLLSFLCNYEIHIANQYLQREAKHNETETIAASTANYQQDVLTSPFLTCQKCVMNISLHTAGGISPEGRGGGGAGEGAPTWELVERIEKNPLEVLILKHITSNPIFFRKSSRCGLFEVDHPKRYRDLVFNP